MILYNTTTGLINNNNVNKGYYHGGDHVNDNYNDNDFWAIIVSTSRYWFNYRHSANAISVYKTMKDIGISDSHIIFMNAMDVSTDSRNNKPGYVMFNNNNNYNNNNINNYLFSMNDIIIDYYNEEVNVQSFIHLLTGRIINTFDNTNILNSNLNSSILIYLTGHGGDEFFKFHDYEELSAQELGNIFQEMYIKNRYKEILLILDTCQAITMSNYIISPNIITLASSNKGENSYAYKTNDYLGVATSDRFTYSMYITMQKYIKYKHQYQYSHDHSHDHHHHHHHPKHHESKYNHITLYDFYKSFNNHELHSTVSIHQSINSTRNLKDIKLFDFIHPYTITTRNNSSISDDLFLIYPTNQQYNNKHHKTTTTTTISSMLNHEFINALWMESNITIK